MAAQDPTEGVRDYETALAKIGTLIFSRKRVDGTSWGDDFNSMSTCVQVRSLSVSNVFGGLERLRLYHCESACILKLPDISRLVHVFHLENIV